MNKTAAAAIALASVLGGAALLAGVWPGEAKHDHATVTPAPSAETSLATAALEPAPSSAAEDEDEAAPMAFAADDAAPAAPVNPVDALKDALLEGEDLEVVVAVEGVVAAHATEALPTLAAVDLRLVPHSGPAIIGAMASLANEAGPRERREAATTLARWFHEERHRDGADAAGNTTAMIDALADTQQREAVDALIDALDEHRLPLAAETLVVQRLAQLRQPEARPVVARFQARVAALPVATGLDEELRQEALIAARDALAQLGG